MKLIRTILASAIIAFGVCGNAFAQHATNGKNPSDCASGDCKTLITVALENHTCTSACKNGRHAYRKGETTTAIVYASSLNGVAIKKHACNDGCKNGRHNYLKGEIACDGQNCKSLDGVAIKKHVCNDGCNNGAHHYLKGEIIASAPCNSGDCKSLTKVG